MPDHLVDEISDGIQEAHSGDKLQIMQALAEGWTTVKEMTDKRNLNRRWVYKVIDQMKDREVIEMSEGTGKWNSNEYRLADAQNPYGVVHLGIDQPNMLTNQGVYSSVRSNNHVRGTTQVDHPSSRSPKMDSDIQRRQKEAARAYQEQLKEIKEQNH